jgi:hypothetical protein
VIAAKRSINNCEYSNNKLRTPGIIVVEWNADNAPNGGSLEPP